MGKNISKAESGYLTLNMGSCVFYVIITILLFLSDCSRQKDEENTIYPNHTQPSWISEYPIVFIGNWDAMPIFRRRIGGNPTWQQDAYYKENSDEEVKKYKDMGVTMMLLHFYKGFGLDAEKEHMDEAKKLASVCKQNGLKVGVYIGSTIGYETFLVEKPEASAWFVPDFMGQPVLYGDQTFRKRVYFMHPGFIQYMKKVIKIAVVDFKADLIHFDNTSLRGEPVIFHHPLAIEHFRTYLQNKYTPEMLKKRFGFTDMRYIEPPRYNEPMGKINDPLFQEWTDFRCQQLADFYGIMGNYIRSLNPEVAVVNNPHSGLSGTNTMWNQGIDYPRILSHTDMVWTEEGNDPAVTDDGVLVSKIRTYKMARTLNNRILTYTSDSKLEMAEAMAYNRQGLGMIGGLKEMEGNQLSQGFELSNRQKNYIKFFHRNFECFRGINAISDVAVLHSYATMAFNNDRPYESTYLYEQVLIQHKIPFDIVFDDQLKDLSKYKVLILADQECLSDDKENLIRAFVQQGGGLVATEFTSLYTEWRERKSDFGLKDLFHVNPPDWNGRSSAEKVLNIPVQKTQVGRGKAVYIPEVRPSLAKPSAAAMTSNYWKLPLNYVDLVDAVVWAAGKELSIAVNAPGEVTTEVTMSENGEMMMIHLLNYNVLKSEFVRNIDIRLFIPQGKQVRDIQLLSPDREKNESLPFETKDRKVIFRVPVLEVYDLVVINLNPVN